MTAEPTLEPLHLSVDHPSTFSRILGPLMLCLAGAILVAWTWLAWPDVLVDFGRELYMPWRLAAGDVLYRDVAHYNGPFSPYWNALCFRLLGVGLHTLVWVNLAGLAILVGLVYALLKQMAGRLAATIGGLLLLGVFAFGQYSGIGNYNYICPYSHDAVHGLILSLAAIWCLARYDRSPGAAWLIGAGLALGLGFLTRIESFVPGAAACLLLLAGTMRGGRAPRRSAWHVALFACAALLPALVAWVLLSRAMPAGAALRGVLGSWRVLWAGDAPSMPYFRESMGIAAPAQSLGRILLWLLGYAAIFIPALVCACRLRRDGRPRAGLLIATFLGVFLAFVALRWQAAPLEAARPWPLFAAIVLAGCILPQRGGSDDDQRRRRRLAAAFALFALLMLGKIILNARTNHYGFLMAMPAAMLLVAVLVGWVPEWIARRGGDARLFQAVALAVMAAFIVPHLQWTGNWLKAKQFTMGREGDSFRTDERGKPVGQALEFVEKLIRPDETLVVLPEGVMLNYLGRRANPTPYANFMPTEMAVFGEATILESLRRAKPDWIILVHKDTSEFQARFFGRDYARDIGDWVRSNYREVRTIYARPFVDNRFGILILRRR